MYVGLAFLACLCLGTNGRRVQSSFTPAQVRVVLHPTSSHAFASGSNGRSIENRDKQQSLEDRGEQRHLGNWVKMRAVDESLEGLKAKPLGVNHTMNAAEQIALPGDPDRMRSDASSSSDWRWGDSAQML